MRDLSREFINGDIQSGHHSGIIDARVSLALYRQNQQEIEDWVKMTSQAESPVARDVTDFAGLPIEQRVAIMHQLAKEKAEFH